MKKILKVSLLFLIVVLSLILIFNSQISNLITKTYHPTITQSVVQKNINKPANFDFSKAKSVDFPRVVKAKLNQSNVKVIGKIIIPKIGIDLPIGKGVDNNTLALAAGTMRDNQKMGIGNFPLAGHHMEDKKVLFSPLYYKAKVGQYVYLTDMNKIYKYRIYQRKFIKATDLSVINDTKNKIVTLITCDATGVGRLMIRGTLVDITEYSKSSIDKIYAQ
ncbi:sortase A [Apilactobacillus ozensis DSM 23829 = JCM 17196]|uniref:Sortase A n=1 Tax=Apilactobacillus ozensis DSM 23829 = JCM 17196 TaxID=1423781 RepID=A0A0R2AV15_9LACO|nr:class A sortase [Apilactobacillus ozensis]KRM69332.1 sortase A [Apilactobacillus ozensis DSM 23829 = JCM 17196]